MFQEILEKLADTTVLVIGDVMLDRYWWGDATKISPEAPVPVVHLKNSSIAAGGAANVAANLAGLGVKTLMMGTTGRDPDGKTLIDELERLGVSTYLMIGSDDRPTTVKTRIIAHNQQIARVDQESRDPLGESDEKMVCGLVENTISQVDAVVVSDYAKGFLTPSILKTLIASAGKCGIPVLVDPKGKDYSKYNGATVLTPNRHEAADACGINESEPDHVLRSGAKLLGQLNCEALLITRGDEGMSLFMGERVLHLPTTARRVYDVTGAGDTVIAALAGCMAAGADLPTAAKIANVAAGVVVESVGTTRITIDELKSALTDA
jgi:D-beta-D-heptose 7-phosphate kinase/D-beta-D-heptose 1-phosphate adenosyltransferase